MHRLQEDVGGKVEAYPLKITPYIIPGRRGEIEVPREDLREEFCLIAIECLEGREAAQHHVEDHPDRPSVHFFVVSAKF